MRLYSVLKNEEAKDLCRDTLRINIPDVAKVEIHGSDFSDDGDDYCEYRVYDSKDQQVYRTRQQGY